MASKLIDIIAGARPNFVKIAPVIQALKGSGLNYRLVHTGQHYDRKLSGEFFSELRIPDPDVNFGVGSGTQAEQTAGIMIEYENLLRERPSDLCLVVGDVTSTMACAIAAQKLRISVAHIEAGIRSGDWTMPEEINRMVTDSITNYFFTTSENANENLRRSGIEENQIFFVGNTMIDTLLKNEPRFRSPSVWNEYGLEAGQYIVVTLHRPSNVDEEHGLACLLEAIVRGARGLLVIFPVHPRTAKVLEAVELEFPDLRLVEPLGYLEFNYLVKHSKAVVTDSGGITEETTVLGIPCMTVRDSTERPETVTVGTNELLGTDPGSLEPAFENLFAGEWKKGAIPEKWDGKTAERIVSVLERVL